MSTTAIRARVVLTRPQEKNEALAVRLAAAGLPALLLPALRIRPLPSGPASLPVPADYDLIVFVSGHAGQFYLQALARHGCGDSWPAGTLAATVGVASAQKLKDSACIPSEQIIHPGHHTHQDSESLLRLLEPRLASMSRVLIVRGTHGREWLGSTLEQAGLEVARLAMYERIPEQWSDLQATQFERALNATPPVVLLLTSNESVVAVHNNIRRLGMEHAWRQTRFVVIHERIARRLQSTFTASGKVEPPMVKICQPDDDSIFQAIIQAASL
ncbi:uroporphyrinogen-III synthase [Pollutimonas harenae]|uniref:Uroporphyrinogen-III synthase n=1 Tax=Pollutimonas harenae TaxID=657015 RepID=A0A853H206_9BURK|nr:uroporphyrinogen-III synthase [Pollutimonas harenae]NYT85829.1 uroporphyrinogen-III synthase [Pollutimonas harenae]